MILKRTAPYTFMPALYSRLIHASIIDDTWLGARLYVPFVSIADRTHRANIYTCFSATYIYTHIHVYTHTCGRHVRMRRQVVYARVRVYIKVHSSSSCMRVYAICSWCMCPLFMGVLSLRTEQERRRGCARVHRPAGSFQCAPRSSLENQYQTALISWPEICH